MGRLEGSGVAVELALCRKDRYHDMARTAGFYKRVVLLRRSLDDGTFLSVYDVLRCESRIPRHEDIFSFSYTV